MNNRTVILNAVHTWCGDIPEPSLGIEMNALCEAMDTEVGGKEAGVKILMVRIHMGLEGSDCIRVIGVMDSTEERATPNPVGEVVLHFCLQLEVEEVRLGELKDIVGIQPKGGLDGHHGVKPRDC